MEPRGCFNIKMPSYRCINSHYKCNSVSNPYYLYNEYTHTWKNGLSIEIGPSWYFMHIACNILSSFIVLFSDTALGHKCRKHAHGFVCFALLWSYHHAFEGLMWSHSREGYFNHTHDCPVSVNWSWNMSLKPTSPNTHQTIKIHECLFLMIYSEFLGRKE